MLIITYKRSQTYVDTVYKKRSTLKFEKAFIQISAYLYQSLNLKVKAPLTIQNKIDCEVSYPKNQLTFMIFSGFTICTIGN